MAFIADTLLPSSFKGVRFLADTYTVTRGRKIITHTFVNKEDETEDLGNTPRTFNINAVIAGAFYYDNKKALENVLSVEGAGVLQLGDETYFCVAQPYTLSESREEVGVGRYTLVFTEQKGVTYPAAATDVSSLIANLANEIYDFVRDDLNGQYIVNYIENVNAAAQTIRNLTNTLNFISEATISSSTDKTNFDTVSDNLYNSAFKVAKNDGDIGGNIADVIFVFDSIIDEGQLRFDISSALFEFGSNDIFLDIDSYINNERDRNTYAINGAINVLALFNMYDAARVIEYKTVEELDNITTQLAEKYEILASAKYLTISDDLLDRLNDMQVQSRKFFNQLRLTLYRIKDVFINKMPLTLLTYKYYGSQDNFDEIQKLNNIFNPSMTFPAFFNGEGDAFYTSVPETGTISILEKVNE